MLKFILLLCTYYLYGFSKASLIPSVSPPTDILAKRYLFWSGGIHECEDFKNKRINIEKLVIDKKNKTLVTLDGEVDLNTDTSDEMQFMLHIYKKVNDQWEYYFNVKVKNLCDHVSEKNKPWSPFIEQMKVNSCPIHKGKFSFRGVTLDTTGFPFTEANDGSYKAQAEVYEGGVLRICMIGFAEVGPIKLYLGRILQGLCFKNSGLLKNRAGSHHNICFQYRRIRCIFILGPADSYGRALEQCSI